jgi:hypothetical protein
MKLLNAIVFCLLTIAFVSGCEDTTRRPAVGSSPGKASGGGTSTAANSSEFSDQVNATRNQYNEVVKEFIGVMTEFVQNMENVKDDASADQAINQLDGIIERIDSISKKIKSLPRLSRAEEVGLYDYKPEMNSLQNRIKAAVQTAGPHLAKKPAFMSKMQRFQNAIQQIPH